MEYPKVYPIPAIPTAPKAYPLKACPLFGMCANGVPNRRFFQYRMLGVGIHRIRGGVERQYQSIINMVPYYIVSLKVFSLFIICCLLFVICCLFLFYNLWVVIFLIWSLIFDWVFPCLYFLTLLAYPYPFLIPFFVFFV